MIIMQVSVQIGLNLTGLELSLAISHIIWFELGLNFTNSSLNILILWGPCPSRNRTYESVISEGGTKMFETPSTCHDLDKQLHIYDPIRSDMAQFGPVRSRKDNYGPVRFHKVP